MAAAETPVVVTKHRIASVHSLTGEAIPPADLADRCILTVSGIGNPASFETSLEQMGGQVTSLRYTDHHEYCAADMQYIHQTAQEQGVEVIACTGKDAVKWPQGDWATPVVVVDCELEILEGDQNVQLVIDKARQAIASNEYD